MKLKSINIAVDVMLQGIFAQQAELFARLAQKRRIR